MSDDRFLLRVDPPQLCMSDDADGKPCSRLTEWVIADVFWPDTPRQLSIEPWCWEHGDACLAEWAWDDATTQDIEMENFFVTRFVVGYYGGQGTALVLGRCPLDSVPPPYVEEKEEDYEDEEERANFTMRHFLDNAYYVLYRDEQRQEKRVCAVS